MDFPSGTIQREQLCNVLDLKKWLFESYFRMWKKMTLTLTEWRYRTSLQVLLSWHISWKLGLGAFHSWNCCRACFSVSVWSAQVGQWEGTPNSAWYIRLSTVQSNPILAWASRLDADSTTTHTSKLHGRNLHFFSIIMRNGSIVGSALLTTGFSEEDTAVTSIPTVAGFCWWPVTAFSAFFDINPSQSLDAASLGEGVDDNVYALPITYVFGSSVDSVSAHCWLLSSRRLKMPSRRLQLSCCSWTTASSFYTRKSTKSNTVN